jgi:TonB family protein
MGFRYGFSVALGAAIALTIAGSLGVGSMAIAQAPPASTPPAEDGSASPAEMDAYMADLKEAIGSTWPPSELEESGQATVEFAVSRTGKISNIHVAESSGNADFDTAAIAAVKAAGPLDPLPASFEADSLRVDFTFNLEEAASPNASALTQTSAALAIYEDCIEVDDAQFVAPNQYETRHVPRSNSLQISTVVRNECEASFSQAAWTATVFSGDRQEPIAKKTAIVRDFDPGDAEPISFYMKWGDLDVKENHGQSKFSAEVGYTI